MRKTILNLSLLTLTTFIYYQSSAQCNGQINESDSIVICNLYKDGYVYDFWYLYGFDDWNISESSNIRFVDIMGECRVDSLYFYCGFENDLTEKEINLPFLEHLTIEGPCGKLALDQFNKTNFPFLKTFEINELSIDANTLDLDLPSLEELILTDIYTSDLIIPDFSNMPNLKKLKIYASFHEIEISGELPDFSNLKNLETLQIANTQISGTIPDFSNLPNLRSLKLQYSKLSGTIPDFSNLPNLRSLNLQKNKLSGAIPKFNNIPFLEELDLILNQLSGVIPNFSNLPLLSEFEICYKNPFGSDETNDFIGPIPTLENCPLLNQNGVDFTCVRPDPENTRCPISESDSLELVNFYQATNGDNWQVNTGWLIGNISSWWGIELKDTLNKCRVSKILVRGIPDAVELPALNLPFLEEMILDYNDFTGNLPDLSNLTNLKILNLGANNFTGGLPNLNNLTQLKVINLSQNQLVGEISEYINQSYLNILDLSDNQLSGKLPNFDNNPELRQLNVSKNQLNGKIPDGLVNSNLLKDLSIAYNYFLCLDIPNSLFQQLDEFSYSPQLFIPTNYNDIKSNIFETKSINQAFSLVIDFPFDTVGLTYQWFQNGNAVPDATQTTLNINAIQPNNAGRYELHASNINCLPDNLVYEQISEPIYIIIEGYDLYGQPVKYDQIMVQFDNSEETKKYETEILTPNAGWIKEACNCNRELYLWQFPTTEAAVAAILEIDRKKKRIKSKNKPKGGFNNTVNIGESNNVPIAYNIMSDTFNESYTDSVMIFLLDSGLDNEQDKFLLYEASIDSCYKLEKSKGYSYIDSTNTVSTNYADELWHGTFGYHSITENLKDDSPLKIVPLKIFDKNGKGNLFDMVCAIHHAIDHNANVINISAGYYGEPSDILESAINDAREKGIFITAAAGNDTINIDKQPQYPAYYAGQYYVFETSNESGDSVKYDNVISVTSLDAQNQLSQFSNYGKQSATIACYGENIHSYGIGGSDVVASGTSMSTFLASKALALEIAKNKQRDYQEIWSDFKTNWLVNNPSLVEVTHTGKQISFVIEEAIIKGCTNPNDINYFPFANEDDGSCVITNIEDKAIGFEMYPNPSNGIVQLVFNEQLNLVNQISVLDCLGKTVLSMDSSDKIVQLHLEGLAKGIYLIRVNSAEKTIIQKLVLK